MAVENLELCNRALQIANLGRAGVMVHDARDAGDTMDADAGLYGILYAIIGQATALADHFDRLDEMEKKHG